MRRMRNVEYNAHCAYAPSNDAVTQTIYLLRQKILDTQIQIHKINSTFGLDAGAAHKTAK